MFGNWIVKFELPLVVEHESGRRGDRFGHGINSKDGVFSQRFFSGATGESELLLVDDFSLAKDED